MLKLIFDKRCRINFPALSGKADVFHLDKVIFKSFLFQIVQVRSLDSNCLQGMDVYAQILADENSVDELEK